MQDVLESVIFGFKEILNYQTMKKVLFIGAIVSIVWSVIGVLIWDDLIGVTSSFIDLIPFSMLRANGAWILSSFLWFCLVLVTFALVMTFFGNLILEKVSKERYSSFSLLVVFASAAFWGMIWFFASDTIYEQFLHLLNWLPFETVEASIAYLLGLYIIYSAIIVTMLLVTSFYSEHLLRDIRERYFPYDGILDENEFEASKLRIVDIALYSIVSFIAFPLLFIPILNFIIQLGLWIWLIKDTFVHDVGALLVEKEKQEKLNKYKRGFFVISAITAFFNFLPLFNLFGPFFGEIAMFHYMKDIRERL